MRKIAVSLLLLSLLTPATAFAFGFGEPIALTNTRYGTVPGEARLASNGTDVFLFWSSGGFVRVTRLVEGVKRVGRPVLAVTQPGIGSFDVLWNGANFVVAGTNGTSIAGRLLDRDGEPLAGEFTLMTGARYPRLAFNGNTLLLLAEHSTFPRALTLPLTKNATPSGVSVQSLPGRADAWAVASDGRGFAAITASSSELQLTNFGANGVISSSEALSVAYSGSREVAIASDGTRYFAAWIDDTGGVSVMINGSHVGPRVPFTQESGRTYGSPSAMWSGSDFVLAYWRSKYDFTTEKSVDSVRAMHFDTQGVPTLAEPSQAAHRHHYATALLAHQGRVLLAWNREEDAVVDVLPGGTPSDAWSTFGAADQKLLAAVNSGTTTLVVWTETVNGVESVYAGLQDGNGNWSERLLTNRTIYHAIAGTDGTNFVVVLAEGNPITTSDYRVDYKGTAYRIDARGVVSGRTISIPFHPTGIASNGHHYAIIGVKPTTPPGWENDVVAARLDPSGNLSSTIMIRALDATTAASFPSIASNGIDFLAVWLAAPPCSGDCPDPVEHGVEGARLNADLSRIDATDLVLGARHWTWTQPVIAWNGSRYVVAYDDGLSIESAFVGLNGSIARQTIATSTWSVGYPSIASTTSGDVAILWREGSRQRIANLTSSGSVRDENTIADGSFNGARLVRSASGLSYISFQPRPDAPHHGATRVVLRNAPFGIAGPPLGVPPAPRATARLAGTRMVVEWTGSGTGYRIEYRVADGSWNEVAAWYDGETHSASLAMPDNTAFRVRAYNDFGMSAPSAATPAVRLNPGKRRSVR
ncbi:MAG TPA: fibronectin type III domain-containing protein [Thermoanaerobaculia bacterium]